ncbi:hypothetical protein GCM10027200_52700 [Lentzea nigeriaca]
MPSMRDQDGGGQFGGELEQRGGTGLAWGHAELADAFGELVGADGAAGLSAGEQPVRGSLVVDDRVASSGGNELAEDPGEWFGEQEGSRPSLSRTRSSLSV